MSTPYSTMPAARGAEEAAFVTNPLGVVGRWRRSAPWWALPLTVVVVLTGFSAYAAWTALLGHDAWPREGDFVYLSPFYSPEIAQGRTRVSPAIFVLAIPLLFRATCYYYRKAYYRSYFLDPPACTLRDPHRRYSGETRFPLSLNNLHRYAWWLATVVLGFLWYDVAIAFSYHGRPWVGLGTGIMLLNVILLSGYTFSCHSWRHMVGGHLDCFSTSRLGGLRHRAWTWSTALNVRHPTWAWASLFSVVVTDVYLRMLQAGYFLDPHIRF